MAMGRKEGLSRNAMALRMLSARVLPRNNRSEPSRLGYPVDTPLAVLRHKQIYATPKGYKKKIARNVFPYGGSKMRRIEEVTDYLRNTLATGPHLATESVLAKKSGMFRV
jgi:hypothetical protein